ncbi:MAG: cytochrome o ubiquinol oxidase subunit III, partial [Candidatus Saccharimonadales bacterium]
MTSAESATLAEAHRIADDKTIFGFWAYIMTDCVLFASLFATFAVLHNNTFGGPGGAKLFDLPSVLAETLVLLT